MAERQESDALHVVSNTAKTVVVPRQGRSTGVMAGRSGPGTQCFQGLDQRAMTDAHAEVTDIIVDCANPEDLAVFWSALLRRPIQGRKGPYVWLTPSAGVGLGFQRVDEGKLGKNRVHIDVSGPDVEAIERRVEELGGRRLDGYEDGGFLVMADPEGNEFCVVPEVLDFDDSGRAHYLEGSAGPERAT